MNCEKLFGATKIVILASTLAAPSVCVSQTTLTSKPAASTCPVTHPNGSQPPTSQLGGSYVHGNGKIWVSLTTSGKLYLQQNDKGEWGTKLLWYRGVPGKLVITGRRLDAKSAPLWASSDGLPETGIQSSSVYFPTEGCWEVTGTVDNNKLTFVIEAVREDRASGPASQGGCKNP